MLKSTSHSTVTVYFVPTKIVHIVIFVTWTTIQYLFFFVVLKNADNPKSISLSCMGLLLLTFVWIIRPRHTFCTIV